MMSTATVTATRIALILIFIQASMGFVNGLGLFNSNGVNYDFATTPQNQYTDYKVTNLTEYKGIMGDKSGNTISTIVEGMQLFFNGLPIAAKVLFSPIIIYPTLVTAFGIDPLISGFIQLGVWAIYSLAIAEIVTGRTFLW